MQVVQEPLTCILTDAGELVAIARRNGHVLMYEAREMDSSRHTKLLEELAKQKPSQ